MGKHRTAVKKSRGLEKRWMWRTSRSSLAFSFARSAGGSPRSRACPRAHACCWRVRGSFARSAGGSQRWRTCHLFFGPRLLLRLPRRASVPWFNRTAWRRRSARRQAKRQSDPTAVKNRSGKSDGTKKTVDVGASPSVKSAPIYTEG